MKKFLVAAIAILMTAAATAQGPSISEIRSLAQQSRYEDAYDGIERYLARRPADEEARLLKGVLLTRLDRIDEAIDAFRSLARDNPQLPEPVNNLAVLYAAQGRYDDAKRALEKAVELQPHYGTARENLGDIYARLAHLEYMRAYEIDANNTRALDKANTVVDLFERISSDTARTQPLPEPEPTAVVRAQPEPPAPLPPPPPVPEPVAEPEPQRDLSLSASAGEVLECYSISGLDDASDAELVAEWFRSRGAEVDSGVREEKEYLNFQAYVPPLESRIAAKALMEKMKTDDISDISVVYKGELADGISLGVYTKESSAQLRDATLKAMGYDAEYRQRDRTRRIPFVDATALEGIINESAFSQAFPGLAIVPMPCG